MKDVYGDHYQYQPSLTEKQTDETNGLYGYTVGKGHITFHVTDGYASCYCVIIEDIKSSTSSRGAVFVLIKYIDECHNES